MEPAGPAVAGHDTPEACFNTYMTVFRVPINIAFPGAGSPGANIWHIRTLADSGVLELAQANALVGIIRTFYGACAAFYPNTTTLTLGTVTSVTDQREISPTMAPVSGAGSGSSMQALAVVVTWKTSIAARRGRGRTFVGPLHTAAVQSDGTPAGSVQTGIQAAASALVTSSLADLNGAIGIWGYQFAHVGDEPRPSGDPRILRDVTAATVRDLFGVLRSRRD